MTEKVVNLQGEPVNPNGETPQEVIDLIERCLSAARGETYPTIAIILVDKNGASVESFITGDQGKALLGALEVLKYRVLKEVGG